MLTTALRLHWTVWLSMAAILAATRTHVLAPLPDATLAVFFLAGLFGMRTMAFVSFLGIVTGADYLAVSAQGVSDWCITPAYAFLAPTYASLWLAGKFAARLQHRNAPTWLILPAILAVAVGTAFVISNTGFYLFSGYFAQMSPWQYSERVAHYFTGYAWPAFVYAGAALIAQHFVQRWRVRHPADLLR